MNFLDNINKETIIICKNGDKEAILKCNKIINIKLMTLQEFQKKYLFTYDESAIIYLMNKLSIRYEIAKMYLDNLHYIEDKSYHNQKLDNLVNIKNDLINNNLLIYNKAFQEYVKSIDIILYNIPKSPFLLRILNNLNYKFISKEWTNFSHNVIEFTTIEEEVEYVAYQICSLIDRGVDINKIKLTNVDTSYYSTINRIFSLHNLHVNIKYHTTLASYQYVEDFITSLKELTIPEAVNNLNQEHELYYPLLSVVNSYIKYENKDLIIYHLYHTNISSETYQNAISIVDYLEYNFSPDEYIFLIGFNDKLIPHSFNDTDYITDNIKSLVGLPSTKEKNIILKEEIINILNSIKNLTITYKLKDTKSTFYPSNLVSSFNEPITTTIDETITYSSKYSQMKLVKLIDKYLKYGTDSKELHLLKHNFPIKYNSFNNEYKLINRVMDKLNMSYSKMQVYNKCAFRYYLSDILKLDIFEKNFSTDIGNLVHETMENSLKDNNSDIDSYIDNFIKSKDYTKKELFFLEKYRNYIKALYSQVMLEKDYCSLDKAMYEKYVEVEYGNNIKFLGFIDKILYHEKDDKTYLALIDYKTGHDEISLKYLDYGLDIQLPIYLYLSNYLNLRNIVYSGFYLQKLDISNNDYRLLGYSSNNEEALSMIDKNYAMSSIIRGMKLNKDGSFSRNAKILSAEDIDKIKLITQDKISEVINNIKSNTFTINPKVDSKTNKNIGCEYCKFKDICFVKSKDFVKITPNNDFGGDN